jgi:hypothetical protein
MRSEIIALGLILGTLVAVPAFAQEGGSPAHRGAREQAARRPGEELRAKFEAGVAAQNAEVAKAIADGTVTKDEAKAVRAAGAAHCIARRAALITSH